MDIVTKTYRSQLKRFEEFHGGAHLIDEYYSFYKFFPEGYWISKNPKSKKFDFVSFIETIDLKKVQAELNENDPLDKNYNFIYHSGKYKIIDGVLNVYSSHKLVVKHSSTRVFKMDSNGTLVETSGNNKLVEINTEL